MTKNNFIICCLFKTCTLQLAAQNNEIQNPAGKTSGVSKDMIEDTLDFYDETLYETSPNKNIFVWLIENPQLLSDVTVNPDAKLSALLITIPDTYKFLDIKLYDKNFGPLLTRRRTPGTIELDISEFSNGIYYLKLINTQTH
ncbi:MAG: hypothetical protein BWY70_01665 [Bacteroidetes bacterium ADurb.Bin408]|nr:MAG: hypothetical protein BWY70_01665 [Bacteroidetes bacterium ADurb.Bin408]